MLLRKVLTMKNIKFDNGKKHRYLIAYWPCGAAQWSWVSHIIDTEDDFKKTMLYLVEEYDIWNETESQEDICVFKLTDTPEFTIVTKKETIETVELDFS